VTARVAVVTFPGSLDDGDAARAVRIAGAEPVRLWHGDPQLHGVDAVVLPGGFSYGDYLRCGAIARFAPVMETIVDAARGGLPVSASATASRSSARPTCCRRAHPQPAPALPQPGPVPADRDSRYRLDERLQPGREVLIPVKNGEGRYVADTATLDQLEAEGRVVARYVGGNPNGSQRDIAAITNAAGNVVGIMPHPEHAVEALTGPSLDGLGFFTSVLKHLVGAPA
jgi:phosphoribosylformylglycinamidine synthase